MSDLIGWELDERALFKISKNDRWILKSSVQKIVCYHSSGGSYEVIDDEAGKVEHKILVWAMEGGIALQDAEASFENNILALDTFREALKRLCSKKIIKITHATDMSVLSDREKTRYKWLLEHFCSLEQANSSRVDIFLRLRRAKVCVIGMGGLGSMLTQLLASSGVLHFTLIDGDCVAADNLPRQILYKNSDEGQSKVVVMKRVLEEYEPLVKVTPVESHIDSLSCALERLKGFDLVVLCGDQPRLQLHTWVGEASLVNNVPYIAMGGNWVGPISIPYKSPCYICQARFNRAHIPDYEGFVTATLATEIPPRAAFGPGVVLMASLMSTICVEFLAEVAPEKYNFERFKCGIWKENTVQKLVRYTDCRRCS
ncbi:HesA/MoeB/ThiF family protein [Pseudomonas poae]|uniref:HesA/MoeB/ThiF family protein n=1 Tax=Pseudomonas poae TaxID=200451 RepID=UPI00034B7683|nr:ThiF family adenylyltransferase [Pseudomonas poae]MBC3195507.1 ThiF family adenylyltransferase [Pseudomonas poae]